MTASQVRLPFFRDVDRETLYESVAAARALANRHVRLPLYRSAGHTNASLLEVERISGAASDQQLAAVMNRLCPHLAALEPVYRFHALRAAATEDDRDLLRGLLTWNAFTTTYDPPATARLVEQDALNYAVPSLLGEVSRLNVTQVAKAIHIYFAGADEALEYGEELASMIAQLRDHHRDPAYGRDDIVTLLQAEPEMALLAHGALESMAGFPEREARLGFLHTMEEYAIPVCTITDNAAEPALLQPLREKFQALLTTAIKSGAIGAAYGPTQSGDKLFLSFHATQRGAREAARQMAPRHEVLDASHRAVTAAAPLVC